MEAFTSLFTAIDQTTKTNNKIKAIVRYFTHAKEDDKVHAVSILIGNKPKRPLKTSELKEWAAKMAELPMWLFEESYYVVGDLAETIALLPPPIQNKHYTLQETNGIDIRNKPLQVRREILKVLLTFITEEILLLSEAMDFNTWEEVGKFREFARTFYCEGLMLKRKSSGYETGRRRGNWWKWKADPRTVNR
jgi:hypothetical protein